MFGWSSDRVGSAVNYDSKYLKHFMRMCREPYFTHFNGQACIIFFLFGNNDVSFRGAALLLLFFFSRKSHRYTVDNFLCAVILEHCGFVPCSSGKVPKLDFTWSKKPAFQFGGLLLP
jgi:hypothetical protein